MHTSTREFSLTQQHSGAGGMNNEFPSGGITGIRNPGKRVLAAILALALAVTGCTTNPYTGEEEASNTGKGAGIGAVGGAILGAIAGGSRKSVLIGAGIGALAGAGVGAYMDKQEDKLREQLRNTGVSVTRVGGNITFATNSSDITSDFYPVLNSVALVVNEFEKTYIDISGYTDSTGSAEYNLQLSEKRAISVSDYLIGQQVLPERIVTRGMGLNDPIATNDTPEGRTLNRRVEIKLTPIT
jgi:outer membrane protein OmpA-like peptidoglycan-associated protein